MLGFNKFAQAAAALHETVSDDVADTANDIRDWAKVWAPVETGFLESSIYSNSERDGSTYGDADSPPGDSYLLPEADGPENDLEAIAAVAANYGPYVDGGTRFMNAQPFWDLAVERGRLSLNVRLSYTETKIRAKIG